jgi:colanic acid biosynthesis glycosyl transferase WcaI
MRLLIHDYAGHPFQVQLSRELARRGHEVLHLYAASIETPRGRLQKTSDDPAGFDIKGVSVSQPFAKQSYVKRWFQEREYGRLIRKEIDHFRPQVVISGNTPLDPQSMIWKATHQVGGKRIFWLQDVYSIAVDTILRQRWPVMGGWIGGYYLRLEKQLLQATDQVVLITDDFLPLMTQWGVQAKNITTIPNWAPLDEVPLQPKVNPWSKEQGLENKVCILYSGTLGMKHNPDLLLQLAKTFAHDDEVRIVVISEGLGANWLKEQKERHGLENLLLLPYQPFAILPQVLATADILVAILEPEAGVFSVPSKVLTYMCAGRAMLLAVPLENLSAKLVSGHKAGMVVKPDDIQGFVDAAKQLLSNHILRQSCAQQARFYAEKHFDIASIADRFERVFTSS